MSLRVAHLVAAGVLTLALPLAAQSASGSTHFLVASEIAGGGSAQSLVHRLTGTMASGVLATRATSAGFVLVGGFPAAIETTAIGTPWLTRVTPAYGPLLGGTALTLHGTELNLGPVAQVTVGGVAAVTGTRTNATLQTVLPAQLRPGYQPVTVQAANGASTLPTGIGVLPLLEFPVAHQANVPFGLRYRGAPGDLLVFALALGSNQVPFVLAPFHHGLQLDLLSLVVLPAFTVTDPGGTLVLDLPGVAPTVPIWFQGFSFTQHPGWSPGSFTNVVRL